MLYAGDVRTQRAIAIAMVAISLAFVIGGFWQLLGADDVGEGIGLLIAGAMLAAILRLFGVLQVKVREDGLRARFGPWGSTSRPSKSIQPVPRRIAGGPTTAGERAGAWMKAAPGVR